MTRIFSYTQPIEADIVDAYCALQKGFTDQFVYYRKDRPVRFMGMGRCIALPALDGIECELEGPVGQQPVFFSFNRFDAENPSPTDELFEAFPRLKFMLPEVILVEDDRGAYLQVNSLSPVYPGRIARFARQAAAAPRRNRRTIPFKLEPDSRDAWRANVEAALDAIGRGRISKVVLSRRQRLEALEPFSSKDLLVNLIDGSARGTVLLYRYADVFFCGCTPELLVRKRGNEVESMCLAGTCPAGATEADFIEDLDDARAAGLLGDMDPDDAADIVRDLSYEKAETLLRLMGVEDATEIRRLQGYKDGTAGGMMTTQFVAVKADNTVGETIEVLRELDDDHPTVHYVYVLNDYDEFVGVLSLRTLVLTDDARPVRDVMFDDVISATPDETEEDVAADIFKYELPAMPVVDEHGVLLGIVTVDDAWDAIEEDVSGDKTKATLLKVLGGLVASILFLALYTLVLLQIIGYAGR